MNCVVVTGYVLKDAWRASTATGMTKLLFDMMVDTEREGEVPWRCEVEDMTSLLRYEPMLTAGRAIIIDGQLDGRPFNERGIHKGYTRFLRVRRAEFPTRSQSTNDATTEAVRA